MRVRATMARVFVLLLGVACALPVAALVSAAVPGLTSGIPGMQAAAGHPAAPMHPAVPMQLAQSKPAAPGAGATATEPKGNQPVLLVVGDSISAGYGLAQGQVWVELLAARLAAERYAYQVVNASISGDTTAGGRARLPALLKQHRPAVVIIELGGNDALRGGRLAATRENLDAMVTAAQATGARVLLVGMELPPNYGPAYVREFNGLFAEVAKARRVPYVPAFFAGFGEDLALFQPDRIHPTATAQPRLLDNVWPTLTPLLSRK